MTLQIALLRGINVGGNKKVAMADLRALLAKLGFGEPTTVLQSGNVVFKSKTKAGAQLEAYLETQVHKQLGLETKFLVRTAPEWRALMAANPFSQEAQEAPSRLAVLCFKDTLDPKRAFNLQAKMTGPERMVAVGKEAYVFYPVGMGSSMLTLAVIEKGLGSVGTARNWNTVGKLAALCTGAP